MPYIIIFYLLFHPLLSNAVELPDMGDTSSTFLSIEEENKLGHAFMNNIRHTVTLSDDPEIQIYIQSLGDRLATYSDTNNRTFTFFIVMDPSINAFAGPGGYIGINSGLILTTESENELAAVIAHEIAHVTQRHLARAFETSSKLSLQTTAAIIAAILIGHNDGQLGEAAFAAATAGNIQQQINFTRSNEMEADRLGIKLLAASGYDPRSMPLFFEQLQRASGSSENQQLEFLRTHPVTLSRIADTRNRAEQFPIISNHKESGFDLIKAKLLISHHNDTKKSLDYFRQKLLKDKSVTNQYGYALALIKDSQYKEAYRYIKTLIDNEPENISYQLLYARNELDNGDIDKALAILKKNINLYPYNYPLTIQYATTLVLKKQTKEAARFVYDYLGHEKPTPTLYSLLAQAENENDNKASAHQALAEHYYLIGQIHPAIEQLKLALKYLDEDEPNQRAQIEDRLKSMEKEITQE